MSNDNIKEVGLRFTSDGDIDFKQTIKSIRNEMNLVSAEYKKTVSEMQKYGDSIEYLQEKQDMYNKQIDLQKQKIATLRMEITDLSKDEEKNADQIAKKKTELAKAETELNKYQKSLNDVNSKLNTSYQEHQRLEKELKQIETELKQTKADFELEISALSKNATETEKLTAKKKLLENQTRLQQEKVNDLRQELELESNAENKNEEAIAKKKLELTRAETELNNYQKELQETQKELSKHTEITDKLTTKLSSFGEKCTEIGQKLSVVSVAVGGLIATGIKYNSELEKYQTALTTIVGSEEKAQKIMAQIQEDAKKTPFDVSNLTQANQLLLSTEMDAEDARETILALGDAISATGGGNAELARMAVNLQQVKNLGKASSVDIKQFAMAGIDIYGLLADYLGITKQEASEMSVTWDNLNGALIKASKEGGKYFGAMQKQSETYTGAWNNAKTSFQSSLGELTQTLMPMLTKLLKNVSIFLDHLNNLSDGAKNIILIIGLILVALGPLLMIIGGISSGVAALIPIITAISAPILGIIALITSLIGVFIYLWNTNEEFKNNVIGLWNSIKNLFSAFLEWINSVFSIGFDESFGFLKEILNSFNIFISGFMNSIITLLKGIIDFLTGVFTGDWELAFSGLENILNGWFGIVDSIFSFVRNIFNTFLTWLAGVFLTDWSKYFGRFGDIANGFSVTISGIITSIRKIFTGLIDFITGIFTGNWQKAWQGIVSIFSGIVGGLGTIIKSPLNAVIGLINSAITGINGISVNIPSWVPGFGGKTFGMNIPKIPYLKVGIANVPYDDYLAYLHQGERVLTKEENKQYNKDKFDTKEKVINYNLTLNIDKVNNSSDRDIKTLARELQFYLKKLEEAKG